MRKVVRAAYWELGAYINLHEGEQARREREKEENRE